MGDPAGIGPEIAGKAWHLLRRTGPEFICIADPGELGRHAPIEIVPTPNTASFAEKLPILPVYLVASPKPGHPDPAAAPAIIESIVRAVRLAQTGAAAGIVTNPIAKSVLTRAGFPHPGHTEFLAHLTGVPGREIMMLVSPELRVVPVTIHCALREALARLTTEAILHAARTTHAALRQDFGIAAPRLAVAGLNPHAGEDGTMGSEEHTLIAPAIQTLQAEGIRATGPHSPDTLFTPQARPGYDAAICHYHDQALIPLKTLDMWNGVNVTLGLPIVRTSPDHGTAFDIAGQGRANPASLIAALRLADAIARNRAR